MAEKKEKTDISQKIYQSDLAPAAPMQAKVYYTPVLWRGVKQVFKCAACGTCRDDKDSIIEHVLLHIPRSEQESVFNQLLKEK